MGLNSYRAGMNFEFKNYLHRLYLLLQTKVSAQQHRHLVFNHPDGLFPQQEALSSISSVGQWAYIEYFSFPGPPEGE